MHLTLMKERSYFQRSDKVKDRHEMLLSSSVNLLKSMFIFTVCVTSIQTQLARSWYDPRLRRYESNGNRDSYGYFSAPLQKFASSYPSNYPYLNYQRTASYPQRWQQQQQQVAAMQLNYDQPITQASPPPQQYQYEPKQQRSSPELAKYRYEGNYIQRIPGPIPAPTLQHHNEEFQTQPHRRLGEFLQHAPASFANAVLHVEPKPNSDYEARQEYYRPRRYPSTDAFNDRKDALASESIVHLNGTKEKESKLATATQHPNRETRYFHDIFMRYGGPDKRSFGHVELHPERGLQSRYETQRGNQRYKGEVIWTDKAGGYGSHQWDMAQGKLL